MIARLRSWLVCLIFGHDIHRTTSGGVSWWRCNECGKWGRR